MSKIFDKHKMDDAAVAGQQKALSSEDFSVGSKSHFLKKLLQYWPREF
jgi:hypothetical protein